MDAPAEPAWLRWSRWIDRAFNTAVVIRDEIALSRIDAERMRRIVFERYSRTQDHYADQRYIETGFTDWERAAVERFFPPPPGRVLVGGAGGGREVVALHQLGYEVDALEPVAELFAALGAEVARRRLHPVPRLAQAGYEELALGTVTALEAGPRYDAVVLGWGSIGHVRSAEVRERLLPALARLCPAGPVILSFIAAEALAQNGRAEAIRRQLRRALAALPGAQPVADGDTYHASGYQHAFSAGELQRLSEAAGYTVAELELSGPRFPHAVLTRR